MLVALINDIHFGARADNPTFHAYQKECLEWFFRIIDERNIKHIIMLGDLFDRRKYVHFTTSRFARENFFQPIQERGIEAHFLCGNHDQTYKNTHETNSLDELIGNRYPCIQTYALPKIITIDDLDIQLLPWISPSIHDEAMEVISKPRATVLMGHLELKNFQMFKGSISDHGMDGQLFDKYDKVFSGHYHHRSTLGNITYLGSFVEITWNDYNDPRGFNIFDTATRELEFLQNPHSLFDVIVYDDVKNPDILKTIKETDYSKYSNKYIKILCVNKTNPYTLDLLLDEIAKSGPLDVQIIENASELIDSNDDAEIMEAEDTKTIISSYVDALTLPLETVKVKNFILDVYNEALETEIV